MKRIKATTSVLMSFSTERTQALQKANSKPRKGKSEANILTSKIVLFLTDKGHFASRLNSTGILRNGQMTYGTQKNGLPDVVSVIHGRFVGFEVKVGDDRPSQDQLKRQVEIIKAGGLYHFVSSFKEFQNLYDLIK